MFVLCVASKDKMQDNQDKETSTDETEYEKKYKNLGRGKMWINYNKKIQKSGQGQDVDKL